jgi:hypothetical protein
MLKIIPPIESIEIIATGSAIRELSLLRQRYGPGRWKMKKGIAMVKMDDNEPTKAEIHWYEAHGIGKVKIKVKRWL